MVRWLENLESGKEAPYACDFSSVLSEMMDSDMCDKFVACLALHSVIARHSAEDMWVVFATLGGPVWAVAGVLLCVRREIEHWTLPIRAHGEQCS
jgi:hypothetical protein